MQKLGLGLMRLPLTNPQDATSVDMEQVNKMVDELLENGFTYFDTAYMYHNYHSENVARMALVERHPRDAFTLATKMPVFNLKTKEEQAKVFDEQLEKCGVEYFDYYLLHNLTERHYEIAKRLDSFAFISEKKAQGRIRHIGFSFHDRAEVLDRILTEHPEVEFVQLQLNYLDWENGGIQSRRCWETARKHGKPIVVMEPVKGGSLARLPEEAEELLRSERPDCSAASWALRFAAGLEGVMVVLSGMSDLAQLRDNMKTLKDPEPVSEAERELLYKAADIIDGKALVPCTSCRYCVEGCPGKIPIPELFSLFNEDMKNRDNWKENDARYDQITQGLGTADDCIGCKKCEAACPQHIDIVERLKKVNSRFDR